MMTGVVKLDRLENEKKQALDSVLNRSQGMEDNKANTQSTSNVKIVRAARVQRKQKGIFESALITSDTV
jgi:hypothetical protein